MTVFITGASGGLGRAFALECAERGYDIFITDKNAEGLEKLKAGILRQYDVQVWAMPCDITDEGEAKALFDYAERSGVRFDMLLNVAGIDNEGGFYTRSFDEISAILRVNIEATLRITHAALSFRRRSGRFYIVFVSSLASMYPMPLKATYAASKRFLYDFSIALGQELKNENVNVLALCPGGMMTTAECVKAIEAQGFWGNMTTNGLNEVAHNTISRVLRGKKTYVPGTVNRSLSILGKMVPKILTAQYIYSRWTKSQQKWLTGSVGRA